MRTRPTTKDPQREQAQRRLNAEEEGRRAEAERLEVRRLTEGGKTWRQRRASEVLAYLDVISHGRWAPNADEAASRGTVLDGGQSLHLVDKAAKEAVAAAVAPLIAAANEERAAADKERDAIVKRGRLT